HYERRVIRAVAVGPVALGGENFVGVVSRVGNDGEALALRWASPGARRMKRPDVVEFPLLDANSRSALLRFRTRLDQATAVPMLATAEAPPRPRLAYLASGDDASLLQDALPLVDAVLLIRPNVSASRALAQATREAVKPLWLEARIGTS